MQSTAIVSDPIYKEHCTDSKIETPKRWEAIHQSIQELGLTTIQPRKATLEELTLCHAREYIELVEKESTNTRSKRLTHGRHRLSTDPLKDTLMCPNTCLVALHAVGGVLSAIDAVVSKQARNTFCNVRPPGHHASSDTGMGFCFFNNVAIGARYAQQMYGIERVLIVDWDAHHGNGTQEIFEEDPTVYYFSTHQTETHQGKPFFPESGSPDERGTGLGERTTFNASIKPDKNARKEIINIFKEHLSAEMEKFQPQLVLISCGFDSQEGDKVGDLNLKDEDYCALTQIIMSIADKFAEGRVVSVLEGGYNTEKIASAAKAHIQTLMQTFI